MIAERRRNVKAVTARSKNGRGAGGGRYPRWRMPPHTPTANAATHYRADSMNGSVAINNLFRSNQQITRGEGRLERTLP